MTFTLLAGLLIILFLAPSKANDMLVFTRSILENMESITTTQEGVAHTLSSSYFSMAFIVLPLACFLASLIAEGLQTGFRFTLRQLSLPSTR